MPKPDALATISAQVTALGRDLQAVFELVAQIRSDIERKDQPDPNAPSSRRYRVSPNWGEAFHIEGDANLAEALGVSRSGLSARTAQAKARGSKSFTVKVANSPGSTFFDQRAHDEGVTKLRVTVTRLEA